MIPTVKRKPTHIYRDAPRCQVALIISPLAWIGYKHLPKQPVVNQVNTELEIT